MDSKNYITCHIIIFGIVQGVGYRYFAMRKANAFGLSGYVKNLPKGQVEVEVEGEEKDINEFISFLRKGPASASVYDVKVNCYGFTGKYADFRIKY